MKKSVKNSQKANRARRDIPIGVKVITVVGYVFSIFALIIGILSLIVALKYIMDPQPITLPSNFPPEFIELFTNYLGPLFIVMGFVFVVAGIVGILISRGLWKGKSWARILVVVLAVLVAISNLINLITGKFSAIVSLAVNVIIAWYLLGSKEVQKYFGD